MAAQYEILPLTELVDQLAFLRRYEESLSDGTPAGEMTRSFESLSEDVRSLFTEPIDLVHFREMHKHLPGTISSWQTPGDVAKDRFLLYRKLIQLKLSAKNWSASDVRIDDLFDDIGAEALRLLRENAVTVSEVELRTLKRKWVDTVDPEKILSVVLKVHKPLSGRGCKHFEFYHKSVQEMFAANYIVYHLIVSTDSLNRILAVPSEDIKSLREVLLYVVAALSRDSPRHLTRRWGELYEALREARLTANDVIDCVARCRPDHAGTVAELAALTKDKEWNVRNGRHVAAVVAMLSQAKPVMLPFGGSSGVVVDMEAAALRGAPWGALVAAARGVEVELKLSSPDDYETHDDLLLPLHDSGVLLGWFRGCVGTPAGVAALASVVHRAHLNIRMAAPLDLSALGKTHLMVYTRPLPPPGPSSPTWPLPPSSSPSLCVEGADEGSWEAVAHTITSLCPRERLKLLALRGSRLRAEELPPLLQALHDAGLRTYDWGDDTRAGVDTEIAAGSEMRDGGYVYLRIMPHMPPGGPAVPSDAQLKEALQEYLREQ